MGVVDGVVAGVVADDVVEVADGHYCYSVPVVGQTAEVGRS